MKVIRPGTNKWTVEKECTGGGNGGGGCGAILEIEKEDLYLTSNTSMDGSSEIYVTFRCVQCGVETDIKDVPEYVRENLKKKRGH